MTNSKRTRALNTFAAMSRIPDDYVLAAEQMLLEAEAGICRPEKPQGRFRRFLNSGWGAAVISGIVALAVLAFIVRAGQNTPPAVTGISTDTTTESVTVPESDTEPVTEDSEAETVDPYGFYEGNEVIFNGMYDPTFFEDDPLFTDGDAIAIFGVSSFTKKETVVLSDVVPASRHIGDLGFMDPFTIHYKASVRNVETGEILYHTYANGYNEFDYSPDGQLLEFRDPADSKRPLPHEEAIALSQQFLEAVGIELSDDYVPYARDGCGCYCCGQQSEFTFVYWTREIGGVAAEGYLVLCGAGGRVKRFAPVNTGMYETYGYITQEQVDHTRARLLEALSRTEDYYGDPYEVVEGHERGRLVLGNDGNLYLGIHISAAITDLHGNPGYLCMRINP